MDSQEICFCVDCSSKIKSKKLCDFWRFVTIITCRDKTWVSFEEDDEPNVFYAYLLEQKGFMITVDHGNQILAKPQGLFICDTGEYLICLNPTAHFEHIEQE